MDYRDVFGQVRDERRVDDRVRGAVALVFPDDFSGIAQAGQTCFGLSLIPRYPAVANLDPGEQLEARV
jgi:hypothetical protein